MMKRWIGWIGVVLLLVGCGAEGAVVEETAVFPTTMPPTPGETALLAVTATAEPTPVAESGESDMNDDDETIERATSSQPATVDLSKLTPAAPTEPGEPRVMPAPGVPNPLQKLQNDAAQDLSQRLGVDISEVEIVQAVSAEWRDGSLGCPKPGMMYAQVLTSGYQIMLRVAGKDYFYHTNGTNSFVFCENAKPLTAVSR
ncbi:MAG: hypothetical protein KDE56_16165 [Anaerolineales bacterium]|nr:hypothetical protein [Anaerolineales bacterium]